MRTALIALLALHGIAHLPGFLVGWRLATLRDLPYHTTILAGRLDVGDGGMRLLGVVWLLLAIAFEGTAAGAVWHKPWWGPAAAVIATLSLVLSVLQFPEARIGIVVNIVILGLLVFGQFVAWQRTIS